MNRFRIMVLLVMAAGLVELGCAARQIKGASVQSTDAFVHVSPAATETPTIYPVKSGDTLWALAHEHLGSAFLWPLLWKQNRDEVLDPDWLEIGQGLEYPEGWTGESLDWAVALSASRPSRPSPRTFQRSK